MQLVRFVGPVIDVQGETFLRFQDFGVAMAVFDLEGRLVEATHAATLLLRRFHLPWQTQNVLPPQLALELAGTPLGEAIMWRHPDGHHDAVLGCTRYNLGAEHLLLLMREITEQQRALSRRLHQQRLESTGRLISHIAHDLRTPLASIIYNLDLLTKRNDVPFADQLQHIQVAAVALRDTIAGLLDFVRLGPPITTTRSLGRLFERISSLLRSLFRAGRHELSVELHDDVVCVRGNAIALEQIFVNLLVNAIESRAERVHVRITSEPLEPKAVGPWRATDPMVLVRIADDGPGIAAERRETVFQEFVTSKPHGTGLGLTIAREAAQALGGSIALEPSSVGCCFAVALPMVREPEQIS